MHSVIGDGAGFNTDNNYSNNNNSDDYGIYSGVIDLTLNGSFGANEYTTTATATGTL